MSDTYGRYGAIKRGAGQARSLSQETHCALLAQVQSLIPLGTAVTVLGDGEFDDTDVQGRSRLARPA